MNCSLNWEPVHGHKSVDGLLKTSQLSDGSESYMNSLPNLPFPGLSCMCLNARSIVNKTLDLLAMLDANRMHILAVSETFLVDNILNSELGCSSYTIFRRDRDRHGGGVMLLVHNIIPATRCFDLESDCEILWTELRMQSTSILFGVYYRPPRTDQRYIAQLHHSLACIPESYPIVLCGDFNIAHIDWENICPTSHCTLASVLCDLANDFSLQQLVSDSTRRGNVLDLLFTNTVDKIEGVEVVDGILGSYHDAIQFIIRSVLPHSSQSPHSVYNFKKLILTSFALSLMWCLGIAASFLILSMKLGQISRTVSFLQLICVFPNVSFDERGSLPGYLTTP